MTDKNMAAHAPSLKNDSAVERPAGPTGGTAAFGSDAIADAIRALDIPYVALNPGASFRGLHDSLVNYLGNEQPSMLLCIHEESAVAIAHGYAKVTGRAMAAVVHSNVGLMHATMSVFNAWCDRAPVLLMGATGPVDAAKRRPWIDWIHTSRDQGALVRPFLKWDDQPSSPAAAREAVFRGAWIANTTPKGPVYINFDAELQEAKLDAPLAPLEAQRYMPAVRSGPSSQDVTEIAGLLAHAKKPLLVFGRFSRSEEGWAQRVALAEALGARVMTDPRVGASFPTHHPLLACAANYVPDAETVAILREADLIVAFDWVDLAGLLVPGGPPVQGKIVHVTLDQNVHNGWSMDHQALPPVDILVAADTDAAVAALATALAEHKANAQWAPLPKRVPLALADAGTQPKMKDLAIALRASLGNRQISLLHSTVLWSDQWWPVAGPLDWFGGNGGAGVGAGPGLAVGEALALRGSGRFPVAVLGDGDFLMASSALWTAVRYRIPLMVVISNNASFYNDELHQERVAIARSRPVENKWIGQKMIDPEIDLAGIARAQGAHGIGPVTKIGDLAAAYAEAIAIVDAGGVALVDVRVEPGYA